MFLVETYRAALQFSFYDNNLDHKAAYLYLFMFSYLQALLSSNRVL